MKTISLSRGAVAIVDDADFERLSCMSWYLSSEGYAVRSSKELGTVVRMHREILGVDCPPQVDHRNGVRLDNRRTNLRACTKSQNNMNARKRERTTSRFKGVYWLTANGRWRAKITLDGRSKHLGLFDEEVAAAAAYNAAATQHFGEFARLNTIPQEAAYAG